MLSAEEDLFASKGFASVINNILKARRIIGAFEGDRRGGGGG